MSLDTTASRSAATRPLSRGLVSHRTSWNPGGRFGIPPEAKLPSSHTSSTFLHSIGYLTATTEWYVTGLTRELDGRTNPHAWRLRKPTNSATARNTSSHHLRLHKADAPSFSSKQSSHQTTKFQCVSIQRARFKQYAQMSPGSSAQDLLHLA